MVDDEVPARRRLVRMLEQLPGVEVAGQAGDGLAALAAVGEVRPDLILLDIHMPGLDGLALAARHAHLPPVVFVTAHDEHAVRAFELNAVDYLLKPVRPERLAVALQRAEARRVPADGGFAALGVDSRTAGPRVVTHERGAVRLFDARDITRFSASDKYTAFRVDGEEHLTEEPLSQLEERLAPHGFVRIHRGELVAAAAVRSLDFTDGAHRIHLSDGQVARVSRRMVTALRTQLGI